MRRLTCPTLLAALAMAVLPNAGQATETELGLSYSIWFAPPNEDHPEPVPLTVQDQIHYCAIAEEWSRQVWEMTDGSHLISRVRFYSGYDDIPAGTAIRWHRWDGEASAGGLGASFFDMYEGARKCSLVFQAEDGGVGGFLTCPEPGQVCSSDALEDYRTARCMEDGEPVLQTAEELAWSMAHELSHTDYRIEDEYAAIDEATFPVCFGLPDNQGTDETSMMAWRGRSHWCDIETHIEERAVLGEDGLPILDDSGAPITRTGIALFPEIDAWSAALEYAYRWELHPLEYSGSYDNVPPYPAMPLADPEDGDPVDFCSFSFQGDGHPINDVLVLLDKSGSMAFQSPEIEDGPTAFQAAFYSALGFYNTVREDRMAGIFAFDTEVTALEDFGLREEFAQGFSEPEPGGGTNLCRAIREGTEAIRAEATSFDFGLGQIILLSDGLPTDETCDSPEDVLQAAVDACNGGTAGNGVAINTIAFGDADRALMRQVSEVCDANTTALLVPASPIPAGDDIVLREDPLDIRTTLVRSGRFARDQRELLNATATVGDPRDDTFIVPPGSQELSVEWTGDGFRTTFFNDFETIDCGFSNLIFELVAPNGTVVSESATPIPVEASYQTRTLRVIAPDAGEWAARLRPDDGYVCFPGSPASFDWGAYDPRVSVVASVRNATFTPDIRLTPSIAPSDGQVRIEAVIDAAPNTRVTGLTATARVTGEDEAAEVLAMVDDGTTGDQTAADGVYTAVFNPGGNPQPAGGYRVAVTLEAEPGTATSVLSGDGIVPGVAAPLVSVPALRFNLEDSFSLLGCAADACAPPVARPTDPAPLDSCAIQLAPGESRDALEVETRGLPLGTRGVTVSLGIGVRVRNIQTLAYDAQTGIGRVRFDAAATPAAPDLPRYVQVGFAGRAVTSRDCNGSEGHTYNAAFICGPVDETFSEGLVAGRYETAIDILNPNGKSDVTLTTAIARAFPRQQAGETTPPRAITLGPGRSTYIGCDEIRRQLALPMTEQFRGGFVTVQSPAPLEISATYGARGQTGGPPATEVERIDARVPD